MNKKILKKISSDALLKNEALPDQNQLIHFTGSNLKNPSQLVDKFKGLGFGICFESSLIGQTREPLEELR